MRTTALCFIALFCIGLKPVYACSCAYPGPPKAEMQESAAVFSGVVTQVSPNADAYPRTYTFQVHNSWKGLTPETSTVTIAGTGTTCDFWFKEGQSYIVYASGSTFAPPLTTHVCTRTRELRDAKEDLSELGTGTKHSQASHLSDSGASHFSGWRYILVPIAAAMVAYIVLSQARKRSRRHSNT